MRNFVFYGIVYIFLFLLLTVRTGYPQDLVSRPSPNNGVIGAGGADIVNLYTGELNLNIPLFSLKSKESSVPVSLQYIAGGGVKVQDYASIVGLGWKLNAGGKITRIVRGYPDEHENGYIGIEQWGQQLKNAVLANPANPSYPSQLVADVVTGDIGKDSESDIYFIETPMFNTYFTFDENGNAVLLSENGLKIISQDFYNSTNYSNSKFTVIDPSGNQYFFASNGSRELSQYHDSKQESINQWNKVKEHYVSSWYLDKIISGSKTDTISFEYTNFNSSNLFVEFTDGYATYTSPFLKATEVYKQFSASRTSISSEPSSVNWHYQSNIGKFRVRSLYLTSIKTSKGKIDFNYVNDRQDSGAPRLSRISLFSYPRVGFYKDIRTFHFNHNYLGPSSADNTNTRRLSLDKIQYSPYSSMRNPGPLRDYYSFAYNRRKNLPGRDSDQYDFFGYYTKSDTTFFSNTENPLDNLNTRYPVFFPYTSANILETITNQQGVKQTVTYEMKTISGTAYPSMPYRYANGVRVKDISIGDGTESFKTSFEYEFVPTGGTAKISSGRVLLGDFQGLTLTGSGYYSDVGNVTWTKILSHSEANLLSALSPIVGYSKVRAVNHDQTSSIHEFTNFNNFPDRLFGAGSTVTYEGGADVLSSVSKSNKRGLPTKVTYLNPEDITIKELDYSYTTLGAVTKGSYSLKNYVTGFVNKSGTKSASYRYLSLYWTETENYSLTKVIEKVYDSGLDKFIQSEQDITYNTSPHSWQTRSATSTSADGTQQKTTYYYPNDMNNIPLLESGELWNLDYIVANNILSPVVHQDNETNGQKVSGVHTYYTHPFKIGSTSGYAYNNNVAIKISESLYAYSDGNVVLIENESQERESIGYHNNMVVAKINNASALGSSASPNKYYEFYYEGFENLTTSNNYAGNGSTTVPFQVPFVKPNSRKYLVDYRYLNSAGKWVYVKEEYMDNMTLNPSGTRIDEIRVYPIDSEMETYTHEALIGITSETNSLGHTVFYEYDELHRLRLIRDQDGNIVRTYCYSLKGESVDCNSQKVYLSSTLTRPFYKNDCGLGLYGSEVLYTVPAGTFSSIISQADADNQAWSHLSTHGQGHANVNGSCMVEGTFVALCELGSRNVQNGNYMEFYTTYTINVYKDSNGRFLKQTPVTVTFQYGGSNVNLSVTGSHHVGELLVVKTYIPIGDEEGPEFSYWPDIVHSSSYERIDSPCGPVWEEGPENPTLISGQIYNVVHFLELGALCDYEAAMVMPTTDVYYFEDAQSAAYFYTDNGMHSVLPDGYYTLFKNVDNGPNLWYKVQMGLVIETGVCPLSEESEPEDEEHTFVHGLTSNMVRFQNLNAVCGYTADTAVPIIEVYHYDEPQSEAKFFTDNTRQFPIGDGYYTFHKTTDNGPNLYYRMVSGVMEESGICP